MPSLGVRKDGHEKSGCHQELQGDVRGLQVEGGWGGGVGRAGRGRNPSSQIWGTGRPEATQWKTDLQEQEQLG